MMIIVRHVVREVKRQYFHPKVRFSNPGRVKMSLSLCKAICHHLLTDNS